MADEEEDINRRALWAIALRPASGWSADVEHDRGSLAWTEDRGVAKRSGKKADEPEPTGET